MNFSLFCNTKKGRYHLDEPFFQGGWKYATDGRIAVRAPADEPDTKGMRPDMAKIFSSTSPESAVPFPELEMADAECQDCDGTGKAMIECPDCKGDGSTLCPECDGTGEIECGECGDYTDCGLCVEDDGCPRCKGLGTVPEGETCPFCESGSVSQPVGKEGYGGVMEVEIDGHRFNAKLLGRLLRECTGIKYAITKTYYADAVIYFTADGGVDGMLCSRV